MLIAAGGWSLWRYHNREQLSANDTIVLANITNQTSDTVLDDALDLPLQIELAQTPFLQVLDDEKVRGYMKELNQPIDGRVTPDIARRVCIKTSSKAMVTSSIADTGNGYRVVLKAVGIAQMARSSLNRHETLRIVRTWCTSLEKRVQSYVATWESPHPL